MLEEVCTWLELHHAGDGERRLLVSALVLVTWEVTVPLVGVTTWTRGVCQHIGTTVKIRLSLAHLIYIQALTLLQIFHVLHPRDHNLALHCLAYHLVVPLLACVGFLLMLS